MHDVISAFLDNEPFEARELSKALSTPEGRDLLIDLIALRSVVQPDTAAAPTASPRRRSRAWLLPVAASLMLAGGYGLGQWSARVEPATAVSSSELVAPAPTQVIKLEPGVNWKEVTTPSQGRN